MASRAAGQSPSRLRGPSGRIWPLWGRRLRPWLVPLLLVALLEAHARTLGRGSDALAAPSAALWAGWQLLRSGELLAATAFTLGSAAAGLALGAGCGAVAGLALGLMPRLSRASFLSIEMFRPLPSVALVPLAMLVFGFGLRMEMSVVAFATFWPMLVLAQAAVRQVEPGLIEVARALGLTPAARLTQIVLPASVPRLFVALRLCVAIALVVAVTVEIAANPHGVGYAMSLAQQSLDPASMLAWLAWIGVVGVAVNGAMLALQRRVERRMGGAA